MSRTGHFVEFYQLQQRSILKVMLLSHSKWQRFALKVYFEIPLKFRITFEIHWYIVYLMHKRPFKKVWLLEIWKVDNSSTIKSIHLQFES